MALGPDMIGLIAGGVVGGVVLIVAIVLLCFIWCSPSGPKRYSSKLYLLDTLNEHSLPSTLNKYPHSHISTAHPGSSIPGGIERWGSNPSMFAPGPNPVYFQYGKALSDTRLDTVGLLPRVTNVRRVQSMNRQGPPAFFQAKDNTYSRVYETASKETTINELDESRESREPESFVIYDNVRPIGQERTAEDTGKPRLPLGGQRPTSATDVKVAVDTNNTTPHRNQSVDSVDKSFADGKGTTKSEVGKNVTAAAFQFLDIYMTDDDTLNDPTTPQTVTQF